MPVHAKTSTGRSPKPPQSSSGHVLDQLKQKLAPDAAKNTKEERLQDKGPCLVCKQKVFGGFYGTHHSQEGGTCSEKCERVQAQKPRYPEPLKPTMEQKLLQE